MTMPPGRSNTVEELIPALYETLLLRSPDADGLRDKLEALVFLFGRDLTSFGTRFYVEGPKHHLIVSEDCMFSQDIVVSGTDHHAILDGNGHVLNLPLDVVLEPHSWIGLGATILKGVRVGQGSIIRARSLVTRDVPSHTLVAGVPARVLRSDVTWSRESASSFSRG